MDRVSHPAATSRKNCIARLVSALIDRKSPATKAEHFGHERQPVELTLFVERTQNFTLAPNLDPFSDPEIQMLIHFITHHISLLELADHFAPYPWRTTGRVPAKIHKSSQIDQ